MKQTQMNKTEKQMKHAQSKVSWRIRRRGWHQDLRLDRGAPGARAQVAADEGDRRVQRVRLAERGRRLPARQPDERRRPRRIQVGTAAAAYTVG